MVGVFHDGSAWRSPCAKEIERFKKFCIKGDDMFLKNRSKYMHMLHTLGVNDTAVSCVMNRYSELTPGDEMICKQSDKAIILKKARGTVHQRVEWYRELTVVFQF